MNKIFALLIGFISCAAFSFTLENVKVFGEDVKGCNVSRSSADASIASAMKFNRIEVNNESKINAYHQISVLEIPGGCAVNVNFQIYFFSAVTVPPENTKYISLKNQICGDGSLLVGPAFNMQTRINDFLKESVDFCISEIYKK